MNNQLVNLNNVHFSYFNKKILKNINLSVNSNEMILLLGANGAGKSTLLRILAGIHIVYNFNTFNIIGTDRPLDQTNGLVYLGNRWIRHNTFIGNSPYSADIKVRDMMKKWQLDNIQRRDELVKLLSINLDWHMHQVSDGQRKCVQIMISLLKPFKLVLIDEFLSDLDVIRRDRIFDYLKKECKLRNGSIIYATHVFDDLDNWMNKVVFINNGKCEDKINISDFKNGNSLYQAVKSKLLSNNLQEEDKEIDKKLLGCAGGYTNGRLIEL